MTNKQSAEFKAKIDGYADWGDAYHYAVMSGMAKAAPPPPDPSWPAEAQEAHKALYADLPQYKAPTYHGEFGTVNGVRFIQCAFITWDWMADVETEQPVRRSVWAKLAEYLKR